MNLVFCGTPSFAVPTLEKLVAAGHAVPLVLTQPDRPRGRGMETSFSPVKDATVRMGLPLYQPDRIKANAELKTRLTAIDPDAIIVVGYGRIIPQWMLDLPRLGNLNLHASLLPKYRGAAPIQWAIARGEKVTGVTTMRIDAGLDTGDILLQRDEAITSDDTAETLGPRLAAQGADLMIETLRGLEAHTIRPEPQDNAKASLAPILKKEDGRIDFTCTAQTIYNRLRGFQPWPGAYTSFRGKSLQVHRARPVQDATKIEPRHILIHAGQLLAGCGDNTVLRIEELQLEGKRRMAAPDFINGYRPQPNEELGK